MKTIVADESVDYSIVKQLRQIGFEVVSIQEETPSITDPEVLEIATRQNALLITEDKDFGELVFRLKKPHCGILLIRVDVFDTALKTLKVVTEIESHFTNLINNFSVLDDEKLRIRKLI
jgi:predicted nuclease of predicted toxin-antitoxin system